MARSITNFVNNQTKKDPAECLRLIAGLQKVADERQEDFITSQLNLAQCGLIIGYAQRGAFDEANTLLKAVSHRLTQRNTPEEARVWLFVTIMVTGLANSKGLPRPQYAESSIRLVVQQHGHDPGIETIWKHFSGPSA